MKYFGLILYFCSILSGFASEKTTIRIGVQASGTLAWELAVLQDQASPDNADFQIESLPVANAEAGKIALQSGAVDIIVSDWIWVSKMRAEGRDFTFYPYSTLAGALMVPEKSPIQSLKDLNGKRLGIAGGELDKNWLLLQALGQKQNIDLNVGVAKVFGAPPLINEQLKLGRIDAALNYWHFGAKLEAQGYSQLIDGNEILKGLGVQENVPMLGYVFKQGWADHRKAALINFFEAGKNAKHLLCLSESEWKKIIPLTQAEDTRTQTKLRQRYCEGEAHRLSDLEKQAAMRIFDLLKKVSNSQLTGKSDHLQPGTFWQ